MLLSRFARVDLSHGPTPLEPMDRLSAVLGGPRLWIKRDDCTGLAQGGNKARKLEFLVADALAQGADTLITPGAVQSNHVRMTAAAAVRFGLKAHAVLERRVTATDEDYEQNGNILLDEMFGCGRSYVPSGADVAAACADVAAELAAKGAKPYVIPGGGSNPIGALGYVACAIELLEQAKDRSLTISCLVHGTGSSGTQAGLVAGFAAVGASVDVLGISVRHPQDKQEGMVFDLACRTTDYLGLGGSVQRERVVADDRYVGPGYGQPTPAMVDAITLVARTEGILLDPVYSGKAMAGLIDHIRTGRFRADQDIVFLHTGGSTALFGYKSLFVR
ncbi:MAG: D-cysteine desulfhydrase [Alphaproteobacteria bacterium]|nr:MAG: D-cysteine desulfhydrase [Alphaproteobacteria bacterium]